ncbi:MAG TPA: hypothetical protein VG937_16140 [Polyangiaceae bacterium]|jgi:hypothetical protein|nr:hypothetical protein [Polyangiaceae bacterium]
MGVDGRREQEARRRWFAPLLAAGALLLGESAARAQPSASVKPSPAAAGAPSVALAWSEPEGEVGCLGAEGLARAVSEYLGRPAFSPSPADLTLRVHVERKPERGFRALLQIVDLTGAVVGERELESEGPLCASLDEPLKLAVALMVDGELATPPEPEPEPEAPPEPEDTEEEKAEPSQPWVISADASALAESGLLPNASVGLELGGELRPADWFSFRGSGVGFLPTTDTLGGTARAKFSIIYGNLALCPQGALSARLRLAVCGGLALGTLFARSSELEGARSTRRRFFAATLELRATLTLSRRWAVLAQVEAVSPYRPERFVYELNGQRREFFRMSAPSLVAGLGASVIF